MPQQSSPSPLSLASFIHVSDRGEPTLIGKKCTQCGEVFASSSLACPNCTALGSLCDIPLAMTGRLYTYTIVHRSFPGVETPFISAIVQLDDGAFLKGNLLDTPADTDAIAFDMPVRVELRTMAAPSGKGGDMVRHVFVPQAKGACGRDEGSADV